MAMKEKLRNINENSYNNFSLKVGEENHTQCQRDLNLFVLSLSDSISFALTCHCCSELMNTVEYFRLKEDASKVVQDHLHLSLLHEICSSCTAIHEIDII